MAQPQQAQPHTNQKPSDNKARNLPPAESIRGESGANKHDQPVAESKKSDTPPIPISWWKRAEWVSVEVTAAYTVISLGALVILAVQVGLMRTTAQRQLRAYVVVERGIVANVADPPAGLPREHTESVARIIDPTSAPHAQITIKNAGQTPAHNLVHWAIMEVREFPLRSIFPAMPVPPAPHWNVLGPGIPEVKTLRMDKRLTEEEIAGLRTGVKAIYCHGEIRYRDVFGKNRWTRYRCMYVTPACGVIGIGTDLVYCEEGNEAD